MKSKKNWYQCWADDSAFSGMKVRSLVRRDKVKIRAWFLQSIIHSAANNLFRIPAAWSYPSFLSWCPNPLVQNPNISGGLGDIMTWPHLPLWTKGLPRPYTTPTPLTAALILNSTLCLPGNLHSCFPCLNGVFLSSSSSGWFSVLIT